MRPFENGTSSPSGSGRRWRRSLTTGIWPCRGAARQGPARPARYDVVRREHDLGATRERSLGDDVDRRRLQLDEEDVRVDPSRAPRGAPRGRRGCPTRGRRRRRARPRGARASRRMRVGGAVQKYATVRPRTSTSGRGRRTVATTGTPRRTTRATARVTSSHPRRLSAIVSTTRSASSSRYAFR